MTDWEELDGLSAIWEAAQVVWPLRDFASVLVPPTHWREHGNLRSKWETVKFVLSLTPSTRRFLFRHQIRSWCIQQIDQQGLVLEFGVADGISTNQLARNLRSRGEGRLLYGFDSFKGLPKEWRPGIPKGAYAQSAPPTIEPNVRLVVGLFEDTLVPFLESHSGPVAFVHLDCDLYDSALYVLHELLERNRLRPGCVLLFDELFNYPGWYSGGEYRALTESLPSRDLGLEFIGAVPSDHQVAVRVTPHNP